LFVLRRNLAAAQPFPSRRSTTGRMAQHALPGFAQL
jgi:hypothetical protein